MNKSNLKDLFKRHRVAFIAGAGAGVVLIGSVFAYNVAMTPARPDVQRAPACEVVHYIANSRGLARLPQIEQEQFLDQWKARIVQGDAANKSDLRDCFESLSDEDRTDFTAVIFKQAKRAFINDAEAFAALNSPTEKSDYLRDKIKGYTSDVLFTKEVAASFKSDASYRQDDLQRWLMEHTTARERAIGEPYFEALKRVREQIKKEERTGTAQASSRN